MAKVVYTNGDEIIGDRGHNENCVKSLENLLQKAKDGEIVGFSAALQYADQATGTASAGFTWNSAMIGCLMILVNRLVTQQ